MSYSCKYSTFGVPVAFCTKTRINKNIQKKQEEIRKKKEEIRKKKEEIQKVDEYKKSLWKGFDQFNHFVIANFVCVKGTLPGDHCIKLKEANAVYIDWMSENYSDVPKLTLKEFKTRMNEKLNMKYHDPSRVKSGRRISGSKADGWWGYLLKKDYFDLCIKLDSDDDLCIKLFDSDDSEPDNS